jgi:hypothetical protein
LLCQYIRGQSCAIRDRSGGPQIVGRRLAGPSIRDEIEGQLLPFVEGAHAGTFDRADMNEDVLAAVIGLNEAETLLDIEPLYRSSVHENVLSLTVHTQAWDAKLRDLSPDLSIFGEVSETCRPVITGGAAQSFGQVSIFVIWSRNAH